MTRDTYPPIDGVEPDLLYESPETQGRKEVVSSRAIYEFIHKVDGQMTTLNLTIKPVYEADEDEITVSHWKIFAESGIIGAEDIDTAGTIEEAVSVVKKAKSRL